MDTALKILSLFMPFIAAYFGYIFGLKGKRKDTDLEKEKELNVILSNLLTVWHHLVGIERTMNVMNSHSADSIVPKKYIPVIVLINGALDVDDNCFNQLDESVHIVKKYDPILCFELEGIGNQVKIIKEKYIMPFIKSTAIPAEAINAGPKTLLTQVLNDLEAHLENVAGKINKETLAQIKNFITKNRNLDGKEIVNEINQRYYEQMLFVFPENEKPTYEQFAEYSKSLDGAKMMELQFGILINNNLEPFIDILNANPNISMEEAEAALRNFNVKP